MELLWISIVTIIAAAALEASLKAVLESAQWRARVVETLFALAVGFGAIASLFEHQGMQLSLASGVSQLGLITLFMALGFFAYHTHRVLFVQGFAKTLVVHHVGMILCIAGGLIGDKAYYYILCACIPITSAAVRNFRWFYRKTHKTKWKEGAVATSTAYLVFELVPPIWALAHFFTLGMYQMNVPASMWVGMVVPGVALTLMTFYYSVLFVRRSF